MPEDGVPGFDFFGEIIGGGNGLPGPGPGSGPSTPPDQLFEDLFGGLFGEGPGPGLPGTTPSDSPTSDNPLGDLLSGLFGGGHSDPGSYPMHPPGSTPPDVVFEDLLNLRHPGVVEAPQLAAETKPEPDWDGNVPPDLTDGFEFLI